MSTVTDPELEVLRAVVRRLERLIRRASDELAHAEILLLHVKASFCDYPPLEPPEAGHAD